MRTTIAFAFIAPFVMSLSAQASLIGLTLQPYPDIASAFIDVTYNAGTDLFSASGFALTFNDDGLNPNISITNGSFNLNATGNGSGGATAGSITIGGTIPGNGSPLLTGNLAGGTNFGFLNAGGDLFEFLFTVTGGSLANSFYGGLGATFGVILDANFGAGGFTGNWNSNFNNNGGQPGFGQGVADTATVPTPGVVSLLLAAACCGSRRRRQS